MNKETGIVANRDLRDVSFVMRNLFRIGSLSAFEILRETGNMMPKYRDLLHSGAHQIASKGVRFSDAVAALFPAQTLLVIKAGEESGTLDKVFDQIWQAASRQEEIGKVMRKLVLPFVLIAVGIMVSLAFFLFLIPSVYDGLAAGAPEYYRPSPVIIGALAANKFVLANTEMVLVALMAIVMGVTGLMLRQSVREALTARLIVLMVKIKPLGKAYANLKFGMLAQYIQIVSAAGLDADKRIDLVIDVLPPPLRRGLIAFRGEMFSKGINVAAKGEGRPETDPRTSDIQWPPYIRLAFAQAHEGDWEQPMREFGAVMLDDGRVNIEKQIAALQLVAYAVIGVLVVIPIAMLYSTMGEILVMRMREL